MVRLWQPVLPTLFNVILSFFGDWDWVTPVVATDTASRWSISKVRPDRVTYGSQSVNVWVVSELR